MSYYIIVYYTILYYTILCDVISYYRSAVAQAAAAPPTAAPAAGMGSLSRALEAAICYALYTPHTIYTIHSMLCYIRCMLYYSIFCSTKLGSLSRASEAAGL